MCLPHSGHAQAFTFAGDSEDEIQVCCVCVTGRDLTCRICQVSHQNRVPRSPVEGGSVRLSQTCHIGRRLFELKALNKNSRCKRGPLFLPKRRENRTWARPSARRKASSLSSRTGRWGAESSRKQTRGEASPRSAPRGPALPAAPLCSASINASGFGHFGSPVPNEGSRAPENLS